MNINKNKSPIEGKLRLWPNFWAAVCKHHCGSGPTLTRSRAEATEWKLRCILCFWRGPGEGENEKLICSKLHFRTMRSRGVRGPWGGVTDLLPEIPDVGMICSARPGLKSGTSLLTTPRLWWVTRAIPQNKLATRESPTAVCSQGTEQKEQHTSAREPGVQAQAPPFSSYVF